MVALDNVETSKVHRGRWVALAVVLLASFMDNVDSNVVTVALPSIQRGVGADGSVAQWILAGYALTFALFLITGGRLGDVYGRKRLFVLGVLGFTLASICCGAATGPAMLVGGRFVQGAMAALMVPQVISVIVTLFDQEERGVAFSLAGVVMSVGGVSGPLLGGLLTQVDVLGLGWRAIFYVNVPVGVLALVLGLLYIPENTSERPVRLDVPGVALLSLALLAVMFPLVEGRDYGWPVWAFGLMALSVPLFALFFVHQRRRHRGDGSALLPPPLFRHRSFSVGVVVIMLAFSGIGSFFLVLSYALQSGMHWSALSTGLITAAWPLGIAASFRVAIKHGPAHGRRLIGLGALIMAAGALAVALLLPTYPSWLPIAAAELVIGMGMGLSVTIATNLALTDVPPQDAGAGSGVVNAMVQFGSTVGVAVVGTLLFSMVGALGFVESAATTLWYNVAVFVVVAALSPLLPGPRK